GTLDFKMTLPPCSHFMTPLSTTINSLPILYLYFYNLTIIVK
ncbi:MAG: hypothetical protein ACI9RG_000806, partial [Sulfurimonas sp.]